MNTVGFFALCIRHDAKCLILRRAADSRGYNRNSKTGIIEKSVCGSLPRTATFRLLEAVPVVGWFAGRLIGTALMAKRKHKSRPDVLKPHRERQVTTDDPAKVKKYFENHFGPDRKTVQELLTVIAEVAFAHIERHCVEVNNGDELRQGFTRTLVFDSKDTPRYFDINTDSELEETETVQDAERILSLIRDLRQFGTKYDGAIRRAIRLGALMGITEYFRPIERDAAIGKDKRENAPNRREVVTREEVLVAIEEAERREPLRVHEKVYIKELAAKILKEQKRLDKKPSRRMIDKKLKNLPES